MSYYDVFAANAFREDTSGRRVFCPYDRKYYLVSPKEEERIKRGLAAYYESIWAAVLLSFIALISIRWYGASLFIFVAWALIYYPLSDWLARPLERTVIEGLKPQTIIYRFDAAARAAGRPVLWSLAALGGFMTVAGAFISKYIPYFGGAPEWAATAFYALATAGFIVQLMRTRGDR